MLSKTAQLAADRAVRSIARTYLDAPARYTPAQYVMEHAVWEAQNRGYTRKTGSIGRERQRQWLAYVEAAAIAAIEARIQSTAPNAANAAPLMPVCDHCGGSGTLARWPSYAPVEETCPTCDGTGRLRATREGFPTIIRPGHLGADESLPAYAWPGGYPLAYLPCDDHGDTSAAVILCAKCATESLHNPDEWSDEEAMTSVLEDGDLEQDTVCDGCHAIIAHQNSCPDCRESVDTEDAPHLCPATEPYDVWYLPEAPGDQWKHVPELARGPDEAHRIARGLREAQTAAFVCVQPSRLDFPPTLTDEE